MPRANDTSVSNLLAALESARQLSTKELPGDAYKQGFYNAVEFLMAAYEMREPRFYPEYDEAANATNE